MAFHLGFLHGAVVSGFQGDKPWHTRVYQVSLLLSHLLMSRWPKQVLWPRLESAWERLTQGMDPSRRGSSGAITIATCHWVWLGGPACLWSSLTFPPPSRPLDVRAEFLDPELLSPSHDVTGPHTLLERWVSGLAYDNIPLSPSLLLFARWKG